MPSSGMLSRVALVRTDIPEPHGVTSQKTAFFMVTAVKTSDLTSIQAPAFFKNIFKKPQILALNLHVRTFFKLSFRLEL
jgi:hypothetical protein